MRRLNPGALGLLALLAVPLAGLTAHVAAAQEFEVIDDPQLGNQQASESAAMLARADLPKVDPEQSRIVSQDGTLADFLVAIAAERKALEERARALDMREAELAFAATALSEQRSQLGALKDELGALLDLAEQRHSEDISRLVRIYRAMKPVEAAGILSDADLEVTVLVLAAMSERDAGPIMAKMNPVRARAVSKIILERSRLPGDQRLVNVKVN